MDKLIASARRALLRLAENQALYLFMAFVFAAVFNASMFKWHRERINVVNSYVIVPWGGALCLLRFARADVRTLKSRDTGLLTLMFAWVVVPFLLRFGFTFNNVSNWYGQAVAFFAVYALNREEDAQARSRMLGGLCAAFAVLGFVWGGGLLYCAATVQGLWQEMGGDVFGVQYGTLCAGYDYNTTGMNATCMAMMCVVGASRARRWPVKLLHAVPAAMLIAVVCLTQSRTSRYAVLLGLSAAVYAGVQARVNHPRAVVRHGAALLCAAAVLAAGYMASGRLISAAVDHYNGELDLAMTAQAVAEEESSAVTMNDEAFAVRSGVDATLSDRTNVWKNLFSLWRENPKYMLIGNGVGRTGSRIVKGTIHEKNGAVAVHNTYLQLVADFGLIGAAILLAFFLSILRPVLRVFLARGERRVPGGRALCALVVAILATGMMESQPLGAMTPMNMMLYYALAVLCAEGRALAPQEDGL